ncbi:MAG: autotransporter-associated beta strand repeat-containing protein [Verrucomicrobia bacterium]|nr:autotransporter-associated beta strand repeat-containing protein [Verrucomicrobiota bacterium]
MKNNRRTTARHLLLACALASLAQSTIHAASRIKQDNITDLSQAGSWDTLPGAADIGLWDATVTGENGTVLGADVSWLGIKVANPGGPVSIGAGNTLTLGTSGIDLSTATQNLSIGSGLTLKGKQNWAAAAGLTLDVTGTFVHTGAVVDFTNFNATATLSTLANDASGILGAWATTGSTTSLNYVKSAGGAISAFTTQTPGTTGSLANVTNADGNYSFEAAANMTVPITANTLRYTGGNAALVNNGNSITLNGLMNAGSANTLTISGTGNLGIGPTQELVIATSKDTTISAPIVNNGAGASALNFSGVGTTLNLTGTNTHTGGTVVNAGTLRMNTAGQGNLSLGAPGSINVTVQSGATLTLERNSITGSLTLNGGTLRGGNGFGDSWSGTIYLGATSSFLDNNSKSINANVSGTGGLTAGAGMVNLKGTNNTYTGPTLVTAGVLQVKSSLYSNDTVQWTPASITVNSGCTLRLNIGGAADFTPALAGTMLTNVTTGVASNGMKSGSVFSLDTANGSAAFATDINDSVGTGGGTIGFRKVGANTLTLSGNSNYSGKTIVDSGTISVASLNSVADNAVLGTVHAATSNLGAPVTVANGTIDLNSGVTLTYTGGGETTDRVINFAGGNAATFTQSGGGLLKFTSAFTHQNTARTITIQGVGNGEIAGILIDPSVTNKTTLTKGGAGVWTLSAANSYTGVTTVSAGVLQLSHATALNGGIGATGGLGALTFNGGVIGLGAGDFTRSLAAAGTVTGATFSGNGGWAAFVTNRFVNLGGASAPIAWGTPSTGLNSKILILGASAATHTVDFQNPLDLGSAARTVQVDNGAAAIDGKLSGVLSGLSGGNLTKTGVGTLVLSADNTYPGTTTVSAGTLLVNGNNSGGGNVAVSSNATLGGTGTIAGATTFGSGAKAVFTVTPTYAGDNNSTLMTLTGAMSFDATEVHLNLPANLPSGTYTLATSQTTPTEVNPFPTPVVDGGSYAAGFTAATIALDLANNKLLLTVSGLPTDATKLAVVSVNGGASPTVGTPFSVVVQAQDADGTPRQVTADTDVTLSLHTGAGALSGNLTGMITTGNSSVTISGVVYNTAQSGVALTATNTGGTLAAGNSAAFTVLPDTTPVSFTVTGFPNPQTAGVAGTITVTARTISGAVATGYVGTVHLTSTDGAATLPADYTFLPGDHGVHVFTSGVTLKTADTHNITATDTITSAMTGTQTDITINPAPAASFLVAGFPSPQATGVPGSVTVTAKDAFGNIDTNYAGTIHFTSTDGSAVLPADYTFVSGDSGTHAFTGEVTLNTVDTQSITASDATTSSITGTQAGIIVWIAPTIFTWASATNGNWNNPANWSNDQSVVWAPVAGGQPDYTLNFSLPGTYVPNNNLAGDFQLNQINFGGNVTLSGDALTLTDNGAASPAINQNTASGSTIATALTLATNTTINAVTNGSVTLFGAVSGPGTIDKTGFGVLILTGANTSDGGITVTTGSLNLGGTANNLLGAGPVSMAAGTTLNLNGNSNLTNSMTFNATAVNNGNSFSANLNGPVTLDATTTFDLAGTGNMTIGGIITGAGGLTKLGNSGGPLNLNAANTYTGPTTINAGILKLGSGGSINDSTLVSIAAGAALDVSARTSPYLLSTSTTLRGRGTGTAAGSTAARIIGAAGGVVDLGVQPVELTFTPTGFFGDTAHPALHVSQGALTLNNNPLTVTNAATTALGAGVYRLIQVGDGSTGTITENASPAYPVTVTGTGLAVGMVAIVAVNSGNVIMTVEAGAGYSGWAATNAPGQTPGEDYDNDGMDNGVEYFMGETGSSITANPGPDASNKITWPMDPAFNGTWQVQTSPDLITWTDVPATDLGTSVEYILPPGMGTLFVRLVVTPN